MFYRCACGIRILPNPDGRFKDGLKCCRLCAGKARQRAKEGRDARAAAREQRRPVVKMLAAARARARARGLPFRLNPSHITIPTHCPVLGIALQSVALPGGDDASPSLDRIEPHLGYVPGNVVVVSARVNRIKNDATVEELTKIARFYEALG